MKPIYNAILVAAGKSTRMGGTSKIFTDLQGKTVIERSVTAFLQSPKIDKIILVCREEDSERLQKLFQNEKKILLTPGGETRQQSVLRGLNLAAECDYIVIHDAARPLISTGLIDALCAEAVTYGAVSAAVWAKDTCKLVDENGFVTETPPRERLMMVQTPQIFERKLYRQAVQYASQEQKDFTDDCQLIEFYGKQVRLIMGDYQNIKMTTPEDVLIANAFLKGNQKMRIGYGYDVHRLEQGRKLIIGGVEIPFEKGLLGHSDADVLAHAITDSILGAAAMGDIGKLFPDTDEKWKGADSLQLLSEVCCLVKEKGYHIGNLDATIQAQKPKLSPYINEMREKIAHCCGISFEDVSVKATTEEGLGFTGREEGMAASAVCLLVQS